jgi:hypothetical protein
MNDPRSARDVPAKVTRYAGNRRAPGLDPEDEGDWVWYADHAEVMASHRAALRGVIEELEAKCERTQQAISSRMSTPNDRGRIEGMRDSITLIRSMAGHLMEDEHES